ncbi:unnamed protein product [Alopecurus aequalis]
MLLDAMDVDVDSQLPDDDVVLVFEDDHGGQSIEEIRLAEIERNLGEPEEPHWTGPEGGEELEFWRPPSPRHGAYLSIPILEETLNPFQEGASDAETRLLDGLGSGSETTSSAMKDLQSKFDALSAEYLAEKEKNRKLTMEIEKVATEKEKLTTENRKLTTENEKVTTENEKQQYRITHLIRAVKEADSRLKSP